LPFFLPYKFPLTLVHVYTILSPLLAAIFLIHFLLNWIYCIRSNYRLKTDKNYLSVFLFSIIVLLNFLYPPGSFILDRLYFAIIAVLFLPLPFSKINSITKYTVFVLVAVSINFILNYEILIVFELLASFFIILYRTFKTITGPAKEREFAYAHFLLVFYLSMSILQYSVYRFQFALNQSALISYFSFFYLLIVTIFYVLINTKFRRHFFI
jgi:hypothetical protein